MAKKSVIARERKRTQLQAKYREIHKALKQQIKQRDLSIEDRLAAQLKLAQLPRNGLPVRGTRRCNLCGRARAVYRKFGLCRMCLRELLMRGEVPGGRKASW